MPEFYEVKRIKNYLKDADILNQPIKKLVIPEKGLKCLNRIIIMN